MVFFHAMQPLFFQCDFPLAARYLIENPSLQIKKNTIFLFSLMFCGTGLQYFILFSAFYKKTYRFILVLCPQSNYSTLICRKPKSTSANCQVPAISENDTKKVLEHKDSEEKKHSDTEDLLEDLGRATDKASQWKTKPKSLTTLFLANKTGHEKKSKGKSYFVCLMINGFCCKLWKHELNADFRFGETLSKWLS